MKYCFNKNTDNHGFHEVHKMTCSYLPAPKDQVNLGECASDATAIFIARLKYPGWAFDGCGHCMPGNSRG